MTGLGITARDARRGTLAPQHVGSDRVAVWQYLIRAEGGVARADELGRLPRAASEIPCPLSNSQSAGRGGGDQSRSMMSQRAQSASIMQLTLPIGETKPLSSYTSRSAGAALVTLSGRAAGCVVVRSVGDGPFRTARRRTRHRMRPALKPR
ncbi:MAG: hypothetical protein QOF47_3305 [Mycobacterium sp.]|nr:hypothetical protein [Mycobacterium sp.]